MWMSPAQCGWLGMPIIEKFKKTSLATVTLNTDEKCHKATQITPY